MNGVKDVERIGLAQEIADEVVAAKVSAQITAQLQRVIKLDATLLSEAVTVDGRVLRLAELMRLSRLRLRGIPAPTTAAARFRGAFMSTTPLIERGPNPDVPPTWCVVECRQGCHETWTVDVDDFDPPLTVERVERLITPALLDHERAVHNLVPR